MDIGSCIGPRPNGLIYIRHGGRCSGSGKQRVFIKELAIFRLVAHFLGSDPVLSTLGGRS